MTKTQIRTLLTSILGGVTLDDTTFDTFLQMAKNEREMSRDWMILRTEDSSISFTGSDTYLSTKTLPARFLRVYRVDPNDTGVFLVTSGNAKLPLSPIALAKRFDYKDSSGFYYIDIKNSTIGRTGADAGTLYLEYLQGTADITDSLEWTFPSFAHALLAFDIAVLQKGGIDWDIVASFSVPYNNETIKTLESRLAMWDSRLQQAELGV